MSAAGVEIVALSESDIGGQRPPDVDEREAAVAEARAALVSGQVGSAPVARLRRAVKSPDPVPVGPANATHTFPPVPVGQPTLICSLLAPQTASVPLGLPWWLLAALCSSFLAFGLLSATGVHHPRR